MRNTSTSGASDPDLAGVEPALRRAAKTARELSRRTHTPFIVYQDGKIVDLNAKGGGRRTAARQAKSER